MFFFVLMKEIGINELVLATTHIKLQAISKNIILH